MIPESVRKRKLRPKHDARRPFYIAGVVAVCGVALIWQMFWVTKNQYRFAPFSIQSVRCEVCNGSGLISLPSEEGANRLYMCEACFGLGSHLIRRVDEYDVLCVACAGFGRIEYEYGWDWCKRCGGRGLTRRADAPPPIYQPPNPIFGDTNVESSAENSDTDDLQPNEVSDDGAF